jgi:chromosome segregation ATPase
VGVKKRNRDREKENEMLAAEKTDRLSSLSTKLEALRAHKATLEKQKAQLNDTLQAIAGRRPGLTKALAKGDEAAAKRLDDLESEERACSRRLEGVDGYLAANAAEIVPAEAEIYQESQLEAARQRKAQYEAFVQEVCRRRDRVEALDSELTCEYTILHENCYDLNANFRDLGGSNVALEITENTRFRLKRINAGWNISSKTYGLAPVLEIRPMLPPKR